MKTLLLMFNAPDWNGHFALQSFTQVKYEYISIIFTNALFRRSD